MTNSERPEIILVDDEPSFVEDIRDYLQLQNFKCVSTTFPQEALDYIRQGTKPFILLSDVLMPNMTGLELAKAADEAVGKTRLFEIILFSAYKDMDRAIEALKLGVLDFLIKPFDLSHLKLAIERGVGQIADRQSKGGANQGFQSHIVDAMHKAQEIAQALESATVLLTGERPKAQAVVGKPENSFTWLRKKDDWLIRGIKLQQSMRRLRDKAFPMCSYDDGAWEIVLYVVEQHLLGRPAPVTSACHATVIPQTTAMRKVDELTAEGILNRMPDENDRRRVLLTPTESCLERSRKFFAQMYDHFEALLVPSDGS